jgi:hypothetical protein
MEEKMNPYPISSIQILSILFSLFLLGLIIALIRKKKIREEYAILWIVIFLVFLIHRISTFLGIQYQPASLFLILFGCLFLLTFHFSIVISDMKKKINSLAMTMTLLEGKLSEEKKEAP